MESKYKDAYEQLGIDSCGASWEEVRNSYRRKVHYLHPDRVQAPEASAANQDAFIRVTQAYRLLNTYRRKNHELPHDGPDLHDPKMQEEQDAFENIASNHITGVLESNRYYTRRGPSTLKIVLACSTLAILSAIALMSYSTWQVSQVPPVTPFTSDKPLPLSTKALTTDE